MSFTPKQQSSDKRDQDALIQIERSGLASRKLENGTTPEPLQMKRPYDDEMIREYQQRFDPSSFEHTNPDTGEVEYRKFRMPNTTVELEELHPEDGIISESQRQESMREMDRRIHGQEDDIRRKKAALRNAERLYKNFEAKVKDGEMLGRSGKAHDSSSIQRKKRANRMLLEILKKGEIDENVGSILYEHEKKIDEDRKDLLEEIEMRREELKVSIDNLHALFQRKDVLAKMMDEKNTETMQIKNRNLEKVESYRKELEHYNQGSFRTAKSPDEDEQQYLDRLKSQAQILGNDDVKKNAEALTIIEFRNKMRELIRDEAKVEQVSNSLNYEVKFRLLKIFPEVRRKFEKKFGLFSTKVDAGDVLLFFDKLLREEETAPTPSIKKEKTRGTPIFTTTEKDEKYGIPIFADVEEGKPISIPYSDSISEKIVIKKRPKSYTFPEAESKLPEYDDVSDYVDHRSSTRHDVSPASEEEVEEGYNDEEELSTVTAESHEYYLLPMISKNTPTRTRFGKFEDTKAQREYRFVFFIYDTELNKPVIYFRYFFAKHEDKLLYSFVNKKKDGVSGVIHYNYASNSIEYFPAGRGGSFYQDIQRHTGITRKMMVDGINNTLAWNQTHAQNKLNLNSSVPDSIAMLMRLSGVKFTPDAEIDSSRTYKRSKSDKVGNKAIDYGWGIDTEKIPDRASFGKLILHPKKLYYKNMLSAKHHTGRSIEGFPNTKVSDNFVRIIFNMFEGEDSPLGLYEKLHGTERNTLDHLLRISELAKKHGSVTSEKKTMLDMKKRLDLLEGELKIGNDNPEILKEIKKILIRMKDFGAIDNKAMNEYLEQFKRSKR